MDSSSLTNAAGAPPLVAPTEALLRRYEFAADLEFEATSDAALAPALQRRPAVSPMTAGPQIRQGIQVGGLHLMVRYGDGSELLELQPIHRLPNAPRWVLGMTNLHGALVPVFDLARWLDAAQSSFMSRMLLVLGHGADAAAIVIDGLPERLRWTELLQPESGIVPNALRGRIDGVHPDGDRLWFDLRVPDLLHHLETELSGISTTHNAVGTSRA